ncbi:MAG: ABC transporter ATP-binding protein [Planctomycetes bacterium]|nr:ABC transporter ATP-binding protein [Planctomycetota bacterium]
MSVRDIHVSYPRRSGLFSRVKHDTVVKGVTFDISPGETLGLVGESGSGKSTVGRAILRLAPVASGSISFEGVDVLNARGSGLRRLRRDAQMIFQDPGGSLNPRMRIGDIVAEPLLIFGVPAPPDVSRAAFLAKTVTELLERCGMPADCATRYPHQFSGGQKQRIAIARAIALRPRLIICDEPTSALDVSIQAQIINLLTDLQRDLGLAYLFISHDLGVVSHICHRAAVMQQGEIVETGPVEQVLKSPSHPYTQRLLASVATLPPGVAA